MNITTQEFVNRVRKLLDEEDLLRESQLEEVEAMPVDNRIRSLSRDALDTVRRAMPWWLLASVATAPELHPEGTTGWMERPADMLRLHTLRLAPWHRAVHSAIHESDPAYAYQLVAATRGGVVNPVVAVTDGDRRLRYFSVPAGTTHTLAEMRYVRRADAEPQFNDVEPEELKLWLLVTARDVGASFGRDTSVLDARIKEQLSS